MAWEHLYNVTNEDNEVVDRFRVCRDAGVSVEGFRLLWFHSTRKVARDMASRARAIERTQQELAKLCERLQLPRTRFRDRSKVQQAVEEILGKRGTTAWVQVEIHEQQEETFKQSQRGRPGSNTQYVRQLSTRYRLSISVDQKQLAQDEQTDGLFPLISNVPEMSPEALLRAYGPFGKKCNIAYVKSSATQHRKNRPRSSCGRLAIDCSLRRVNFLSSSFVFA